MANMLDRQAKYFRVTLFSRPSVAVTLCWLIPLIFPDWTSSVSAFRGTTSHDKQPATKLALYPWLPSPPVSLFLSYFLLLPFSNSPLQVSHPPSKGHKGVSGSQRLLFPSSSLWCSLSVRPSERFMWRLEAAQRGWADVLSHDWETDSCKWRYASPEQNTLISKGVIMMWVRVLRSNRCKTPLSTFHLYV